MATREGNAPHNATDAPMAREGNYEPNILLYSYNTYYFIRRPGRAATSATTRLRITDVDLATTNNREGGYDPDVPATDLALQSMVQWLGGRQRGVTRARADFARRTRLSPGEGGVGTVWFSAEVNLVLASMQV